MSEPINQPGATTASIPLPEGYVLDKGEQPRMPKRGEEFFTSDGIIVYADHDWSVASRFIVVRSTPDDSWWPEWLLAEAVTMESNGKWIGWKSDPELTDCGIWFADGLCLDVDILDLNLPEWPRERFAESKIMNPHKRGEQ